MKTDIDRTSIAIGLVVVSIVILLGAVVASQVDADEFSEYQDKAEEWCDQENGDLYNSRSLGHNHNGLHCDIPENGTVHMWAVKDLDWTHDIERIKAYEDSKDGIFGFGPWVDSAIITLLIMPIIIGVGYLLSRYRNPEEG